MFFKQDKEDVDKYLNMYKNFKREALGYVEVFL